jgi:hypothetical protein
MSAGVIFRSPAFSLDAPIENGRQYDLPLGDDLAADIGMGVRGLAPDVGVDEPIREDWGTVLDLRPPGERYRLDFNWLGYQGVEDTWGIRITNDTPVGCLGVLTGKTRPSVHEDRVQAVVASVIASQPAKFIGAQWFSREEYDRRL